MLSFVATLGILIYDVLAKTLRRFSERVLKIDDMLVLNFWHPANRFPGEMNYYTALALLQQALRLGLS